MMNSMDIDQYSARVVNENQALVSKREQIDNRKLDYLIKSKHDRKEMADLSQTESYILNDVSNYFGRVKLEQRLQDIDDVLLPFDNLDMDEKERNERQRELSKSSQSDNSGLALNKRGKQLELQWFTFSPDNFGKLMWDFYCMLLILYEIISIPMIISFSIDVSAEFEYIVTFSFILDMFITFNTAVYINGNISYSYRRIALEYLKLWFWIDLFSSFPYDMLLNGVLTGSTEDEISAQQSNLKNSTKILRILKFFRFVKVIRLLRLAKLKAIVDKIEEYFADSSAIQTVGSFLKLCAFVLFWSHWLGCIFHYIGISEASDYNWLEIYHLYDESWDIRYINSVYWAVTTMITVGYGDLSPQTPLERLFGVFFLLIACGVFSFTMNTIGNTMQQLSQKQDQYQKRIAEINNYMAKVKIPKQLQNKVRRYLQYIWDSHRSINLESICTNLSLSLKYEFTIQVNGTILASYKLLCETFSRKLLIELTQILIEQTIQPDEYVFLEGEPKNEQSLYFIQEGQINIVLIKTRQIVARLTSKSIFGEISFFGNSGRTASAKSNGFTDVFLLKRQEFIELLDKFPSDRERFSQINQEVNRGELQILNVHCYACDLPGHVIRDCPSLHFIVDLYVYQKTKSRCIKAIMKDFMRKDRVNFNALKNRRELEKFAEVIQKSVPTHKFMVEECNVEDQNSNALDGESIQKGFKLRSKFKEDRNRRRNWETTFKQSAQQIQQIQIKQSEIFSITKSLSQAIMSSASSVVHTSKVNQFKNQDEEEEESDTDTLKQKMEDILADYQIFKQEVDKYNGSQQLEMKRNFSLLNDFEYGCDFVIFYPHNNISVVLKEFHRYQLGNQIKPKIETEYETNVFQEYMDYYVIDIEDVKRFKLEVKPNQIKQFLPFTDLLKKQYGRQRKKNEGLLKQPKRSFKQIAKAIMFARKFI